MAHHDLDALSARVARAGAVLAQAEGELAALRDATAKAHALTARAAATASAVDAYTRATRARLQQVPRGGGAGDLAQALRAAVAAELASPDLSREDGSRFALAIASADQQLAVDPHHCLRRCGTRAYEAWGRLAWGLVQLCMRLNATRR